MKKSSRKRAWSVVVNHRYFVVGNRKEAEIAAENAFKMWEKTGKQFTISIERTSTCIKKCGKYMLSYAFALETGDSLQIVY
ncbi:MAG: hypothetical protein AB7G87_13920 [Clostridia bacterium]